jgi:hypothetical protein
VQVAVPGVKDIEDQQVVLASDSVDLLEYFVKFAAWNNRVV